MFRYKKFVTENSFNDDEYTLEPTEQHHFYITTYPTMLNASHAPTVYIKNINDLTNGNRLTNENIVIISVTMSLLTTFCSIILFLYRRYLLRKNKKNRLKYEKDIEGFGIEPNNLI